MESILFMVLALYGLFGIHFSLNGLKDDMNWRWGVVLITAMLSFSVGVVLLGYSIAKLSPPEIRSKNCSLRTEIRVDVINGMETSRDTVYIFTPRKK